MKKKDASKAYKRKQIESASPGELIILLYEGAIDFLYKAEQVAQEKGPERIEKFHNHLISVQNILTELMASLNIDQGGDLAQNLFRIYEYMHWRLIGANMHKELAVIIEVREMLIRLKASWLIILQKDKELKSKGRDSAATQNINVKG
ncbi:flagellar export chaperone FliS [Simkania negevensis]|uniref:Flagellar secretion chaperone FliS n=1 Tax=Simkania negevensis TaxID=83561 RepID=A0ABS3AS96_9BACT|nr:flagellar export chaperone FliS [Simkania negevensis]